MPEEIVRYTPEDKQREMHEIISMAAADIVNTVHNAIRASEDPVGVSVALTAYKCEEGEPKFDQVLLAVAAAVKYLRTEGWLCAGYRPNKLGIFTMRAWYGPEPDNDVGDIVPDQNTIEI